MEDDGRSRSNFGRTRRNIIGIGALVLLAAAGWMGLQALQDGLEQRKTSHVPATASAIAISPEAYNVDSAPPPSELPSAASVRNSDEIRAVAAHLPEPESAEPFRVVGTVFDDRGTSVAGATVWHWQGGWDPQTAATLKTDEDGAYEHVLSRRDIVIVRGYKEGVGHGTEASQPPRMLETTASNPHRIDVRLQPVHEVTGVVLAGGGDPVTTGSIWVRSHAGWAIPRDENEPYIVPVGDDGRFIARELVKGSHTFVAQSKGYAPVARTISVPHDGDVVFQLDQRWNGVISGHVMHLGRGTPVEGATVEMAASNWSVIGGVVAPARQSVTTGRDGAYRFEGLWAGSYTITATKEGLDSPPLPHRSRMNLSLNGDEHKELVLHLYEGHTIVGTVTEEATGRPMEGVTVTATASDFSTRRKEVSDMTDEMGRFRLHPVFGSHARLDAKVEGYLPVWKQTPQRPGPGVPLPQDQLEVSVDVMMGKSVRISGRVEMADGSIPPEGTISIGTYYEDFAPNGNFQIHVPIGTEGYLIARVPDYPEARSEEIRTTADPIDGILLVIPIAVTITGQVVDPDGKPVGGAHVNGVVPQEYAQPGNRMLWTGHATTDGGGRFEMKSLPEGTATLQASRKGYAASEPVTVELKSGVRSEDVVLKLQAGHDLAGYVIDEDDMPVRGALVSARNPTSSSGAHTGEAGEFRIEGLSAGTVDVYVQHTHYRPREYKDIPVGQEDLLLQIRKEGLTTVIGRVYDKETRDPVADIFLERVEFHGFEADPDPIIDDTAPGIFILEAVREASSHVYRLGAPGYGSQIIDIVVRGQKEIEERSYFLSREVAIRGRLVTRDEGRPLEGVRIELLRAQHQASSPNVGRIPVSNLSGTDGRFQFDAIEPGTWWMTGYPSRPLKEFYRAVEVRAGETLDLGDIPVHTGNVLRVRAVRVPGDTPVPGVVIDLAHPGTDSKTTGPDGMAIFEEVAENVHSVLVPSHSLRFPIKQDLGGATDVTLPFGPGALRAIVYADKSIPMKFQLSRVGGGAYYDQDGSTFTDPRLPKFALFRDLMPGEYNLVAFSTSMPPLMVQDRVTVTTDDVTIKEFDLRGGSIRGTVSDAQGRPVEAHVVIESVSGEPTPGLEGPLLVQGGQFELAAVPTGTYHVRATHRELGVAEAAGLRLEGGNTAEVHLVLRQKGGRIVVIATDARTNNRALDRIWASLERSTGEAYSPHRSFEDNGSMILHSVLPGEYRMIVAASGYESVTIPIVVEDGQEQVHTVALTPKAPD